MSQRFWAIENQQISAGPLKDGWGKALRTIGEVQIFKVVAVKSNTRLQITIKVLTVVVLVLLDELTDSLKLDSYLNKPRLYPDNFLCHCIP